MTSLLLSPEVQTFIDEHQHDDANDLLLKHKTILDIPARLVVDQIVGRKKAKEKIPTWGNNKRLIYPPALNIEQASSEKTALHKIKILKEIFDGNLSNVTSLDLTGGLGVDSFFSSQVFKNLHFVDPNNDLLKIVTHNYQELGVTNVSFHHREAKDFLTTLPTSTNFDLVYIDPSRRTREGQKVFSLNQCEPNLVELQSRIWEITRNLFVKTSPLLDIRRGISELQHVKKVYIVSVHNECKELLFYCEKNFGLEPVIEAIDLGTKESSFSFLISEERITEVNYSNPLSYLYEPSAALLKSGAFKMISSKFNLYKLHPNTHLYTSDVKVENFPGRVFKIEALVKSDRKVLKNFFAEEKANILIRNYPLSVAELRKKTSLKEGGEKFLIGCSGMDKKFLIVATRLNGE